MSKKSTTSHSSRKAAKDLPPKPHPQFPLSARANGWWQKKIKGELHYFGKWGQRVDGKMERLPGDTWWQPALELYKAQIDDILAGRKPRVKSIGEGLTVGELRAKFLTAKSRALDAGDITARTYLEYKETSNWLQEKFGERRLVDDLTAEDFEELRAEMAKQWGPVRLGNEVQKVRTVFKYAYEAGLIDKPMRYGPEFKKPSASVMRRHKAANGERMLEAEELRRLIEAAPVHLKAMILLGVNCGLGNHDIALLPLTALDLDGGWIKFPRPKTGINRRCPLWPETVEALRAAIAVRPAPKGDDAADRVFVTSRGRPWLSRGIANPVSVAARNLMKTAGINRQGIGFYSLRHTHRTVADATRDFPAVRLIMGHADGSIDATYRERIDDERLKAVVEYVRSWLWPNCKDTDNKKATTSQAIRPRKKNLRSVRFNETKPALRIVG